MRNRLIIVTAALLLASASFAAAQTNPPTQTPPAPGSTSTTSNWVGSLDFGFRGTDTSGDEARYERYSDLRNGGFTQLLFGRRTDTFFFDGGAQNIGYRDQRYFANYVGGRARANFTWDSTPLNYTYLAATPWVEQPSGSIARLSLDPLARQLVQDKVVLGIPTNAAQLATPSIYRSLASQFDLQQRRDTAMVSTGFDARENLAFNLSFTTTKKLGTMPWAGAFAFNNANEMALPLDNRTNDFTAAMEWSAPKGMMRVAWDGSFFNNAYDELVWDNPIRVSDYNSGRPPFYDTSGYSNGNGPAQGRMSLPPANSLNTVSAMALYKMPSRTTVNGTLSVTQMSQNQALIPWTTNSVIAPLFHPLERRTAEAEVRGLNALLNFSTRPTRKFSMTAKYRYNDHDNRTPAFDATEYVRFDAVPEEGGGETEQYDISRNTFDVNATFNVMPFTALRVGYGRDAFARAGRVYADMADDAFRVSLDTSRSQYFSVRGIYEHIVRSGTGFTEHMLEDSGSQPDLRFYDEAERDRDRFTALFVVTPLPMFDITATVAAGKDKYNGADHYFGLLDNDNTSYAIGFNVTPGEKVAFGLNVGRDEFSSLQRSRNATAGTPSYSDPAFDWTLDNDETINNFDLYLDLIKAVRNTEIRLSYDYSDSDNAFKHDGPRIATLTALGQFRALPNVTNTWKRLKADVRYFFAEKVGVGLGYWYEKFDVSDFATIDLPGAPGTPRIDYLGEIYTGYGNRPYRGSTGFVRLLYVF